VRATEAEAALRGQPYGSEAQARALQALLSQTRFRTSAQRASAEYRQHLAAVLFRDTLESAWRRAL
jgi:CO/xanthine dehydrogenase FAD-binding subunit